MMTKGKAKMKKLDLNTEIDKLKRQVIEICQDYGLDPRKDEFTIVQPYLENEVIWIDVKEIKGQRSVNISVSGPNTCFILPKKDVLLNIFE
ncbi:hypothetical protein [uncultured Limosilactobacillus sp.]|uniref:hypothetical protein n=1 Tax=uncultured Limosilactobacillus sp. TaxID=2837629 RepID=UPI0025EB95D3|nr:hypothetical protein [uncultured Limosilactobacillus sp.]